MRMPQLVKKTKEKKPIIEQVNSEFSLEGQKPGSNYPTLDSYGKDLTEK